MHDKRKAGIPLTGDLPWGSHFCQFYQTKKDLLDVLVPYFRAGLENNEFCVWVASAPLVAEDATKALKKAVPRFEEYAKKGQVEIISSSRWRSRDAKSGKAMVSMLDKAITSGFDGLRLACSASPEKGAGKGFICHGADAMSRYNVVAVFTYPRDKFDAIGLMEVVKSHRFALVRNASRWEVIESSEARTVKDDLKRSEEKLHSLFSNMSEGFAYHRIVLDARKKPCDYIFLEVNEAFERLTGLKAKNLIGRRVTEALPGIEKDPTDWIEKYGNVALTRKPVQFESYSEPLKKWFSFSAFSPHKGYFAVTFADITGRRRAEEELRLSEERLNRSQEIAHLGSWELDLVSNVLTWSDEVYRIFGLKPREFGATYETFLDAVHPDDRAAVNEAYSGSLREGRDTYEIEHRVVRKATGEIRSVHEKCQHVRDETGRIIRSVGMVHDITGRKRAEEKIRGLNDELKQKVAQLESANQELEAFSYSVSHDLRSPLRSIDGFSLALLEDYAGKLDAEGRDYLDRVRSATQRMAQLIDDLLKLSRVTRHEMKREWLDLSAIAANIAGNLQKSRPERDVEFVVADGLTAFGDERLLTVVLENLFANAWKFTENNPKTVIEFGRIDCAHPLTPPSPRRGEGDLKSSSPPRGEDRGEGTSGGNSEFRNPQSFDKTSTSSVEPLMMVSKVEPSEIVYYVRDNGAGFDMVYADKLFNPFQRLHRETEFTGTGIGLATVKRIINRHGGRVWIEGEVGKGATVYFTLE